MKFRAKSVYQVDDEVWSMTLEMPGVYLRGTYIDGQQLFGIFESNGNLWKAPIVVNSETDDLEIGIFEEVKMDFVPVQRSKPVLTRQDDGRYKYVRIAGTSVLNRVGEIDSRELYDNLVKRFNPAFYQPRVRFYHLDGDQFSFGNVDGIARQENVLVEWGTLDDPNENPLARAAVKSLEAEPDRWGTSIGFLNLGSRTERIDGEDVTIFTDGLLLESSTLLADDAAALFTRTF